MCLAPTPSQNPGSATGTIVELTKININYYQNKFKIDLSTYIVRVSINILILYSFNNL